ncbi:MAG: sulfurtransferase TusA family protein [Pseudomonadales bacterium]|nr:sulfurtransferase TusA family protein [Pseudomonadales bacterium]
MSERIDIELDATGLHCPMPLLKLKQHLNKMAVGQVIKIKTTDGGSVKDFATFVAQVGHELLRQEERSGEFVFIIKK